MNQPHIDIWHVCERIADAVNHVLKPYPGFRGKFTVTCVADEPLSAHNISVELRPPAPKGTHKT